MTTTAPAPHHSHNGCVAPHHGGPAAPHLTSRVSPASEATTGSALGGCQCYYFDSSKGKSLYGRRWNPPEETPIRGLVFICHGYSEHLAWYEPIALALADRGVLAFGHDHVGHGRSDGLRCFVSDANEYVDDVLVHVARLRDEHPRLPCYIIGHSMGGMISIGVALSSSSSEFSGCVLMGPLILPDPKEATPVKMTAARVVAWICPYFPVGRLKPELITSDQEYLSKLSKDDLGYQGAIRAQWACASLDLMLANRAALIHFSLPFLILHGENDGLCALAGSQIMLDEAPVKDKTLKVFPGALHNLYLEVPAVRKEAIEDTINWIVQRLPATK